MEIVYAAATATQVAYNTYIYAHVSQDKFQVVTAYTNAALLAGRFLAGVLGQTLIATQACDYLALNYISFCFVTCATLISCFLPRVSKSIYFHSKTDDFEVVRSTVEAETEESESKLVMVYRLLWSDFISAYSNPYLLKWSIWWSFAMCGYFQVVNYIQSLWEVIDSTEAASTYNGAVEAAHTFLSNYHQPRVIRLNLSLYFSRRTGHFGYRLQQHELVGVR